MASERPCPRTRQVFFSITEMATRDAVDHDPHTGPLDVCNVVPGAHLAGCALADLVAGPADAIAITPTVRPATVNTDPTAGIAIGQSRLSHISPSL